MAKILLFFVLFLFGKYADAQEIDLGNPFFVSKEVMLSVESPHWSPDGNSLAFSALVDGRWNIFIFNIEEDTLIELAKTDYHKRKPVWHTSSDAIVFDKIGSKGYHRLVQFDFKTNETVELLNRNIKSSSASFSDNPDLVCFLGFDEVRETWQVYTYDFVYDNLNQLTNHKTSCGPPCFSPNGKHILYEQQSESSDTFLMELNWYGNIELKLDTINSSSPSWAKNSWRFYFIGKDEDGEKEVFSLRKNGEALIEVTNNELLEKDFVVSPNGKNAAVIIEEDGRCRLLISGY